MKIARRLYQCFGSMVLILGEWERVLILNHGGDSPEVISFKEPSVLFIAIYQQI